MTYRTLCAILALISVALSTTDGVSQECSEFIPGDVTCDAMVEITDVTCTISVALNAAQGITSTPPCVGDGGFIHADANCDSAYDVLDVLVATLRVLDGPGWAALDSDDDGLYDWCPPGGLCTNPIFASCSDEGQITPTCDDENPDTEDWCLPFYESCDSIPIDDYCQTDLDCNINSGPCSWYVCEEGVCVDVPSDGWVWILQHSVLGNRLPCAKDFPIGSCSDAGAVFEPHCDMAIICEAKTSVVVIPMIDGDELGPGADNPTDDQGLFSVPEFTVKSTWFCVSISLATDFVVGIIDDKGGIVDDPAVFQDTWTANSCYAVSVDESGFEIVIPTPLAAPSDAWMNGLHAL